MPFISSGSNMMPLPKDWITTPKVSVYLGGVGPCVPVKEVRSHDGSLHIECQFKCQISCIFLKQEFDYDSMQRKLVNAENWPAFAVDRFKEAISHAVSIRFRPEYKDFKSNQYFGDLEIRESSGKRVNIAEKLVKKGIAAMSADFLHGTISTYVTH